MALRSTFAPPNPPELFEGREAELEWLVARLRSSPLTIVWGPSGLGKTGLVLTALARARVSEAIVLSAEDFGGDVAFLTELGRAIADGSDATFEYSARPPQPKELVLGIVSAMERMRGPVVLEDLHALDEPLADALLLAIARRAREGRVIATTRRRPRHDDLIERVQALEPLPEVAIEAIVRRVRPHLGEERLRAVVLSAGGSPRLARQNALGMDVRRSIVEGLSADAQALAFALSQLDAPIQASLDSQTEARLAELFDYGFVERGSFGVRVVPNLRVLLRASAPDPSMARKAALELAQTDPRPAARFEAVRLALAIEDVARVESILTEHVEELSQHGHAEALFDLIVSERGSCPPALFSRALRLASFVLSGRSLGWASAQAQPLVPRDRFLWCGMTAHSGDVAAGEERVVALIADPSMGAVRDEALVLHGDIVSWSGAPTRAAALLEAIDLPDGMLKTSRDLRLAAALSRIGRSQEADALLSRALEASRLLTAREQLDLRGALVSALLAGSRFGDAERLLGVAEPPIGAPAPILFATLAMATERGHVDLARRILEHAHLLEDESLSLRFAARYNDLRLRLSFGPFEALDRDARAYLSDDRMSVIPDFGVYLFGVHAHVALLFHTAPMHLDDAGLEGGNLSMLAGWRAMLALRRGERCAVPARSAGTPEVELVVLRAEAELAIFEGTLDVAARHVEEALAVARGQGLRLEELTLLALRLEVHLLGGASASDAIATSAFELDRLASSLGSARFRSEAALGHWALSHDRPPGELARLAEAASSPVARRRAAALMGQTPSLDALDMRVVAAIAGARPREQAFVLDLVHRRVSLPSGAVVDLSASPLHLKILEVLFRAGGAATKAELAQSAWGVAKYHPTRDDKRMQVAMHRLRHWVELDPAHPKWLLRVEDGYRLAAPMILGSVESLAGNDDHAGAHPRDEDPSTGTALAKKLPKRR